jgi:hypothetical protein
MRIPALVREDLVAVVLSWIEDYPDLWTAALCRGLNGVPETGRGVAWCGLCDGYANGRKRARSARLGPTLPGFEGRRAYQLHSPCGTVSLRALQAVVDNLEDALMVVRHRSVIPDARNHRGGDFASRLWPSDGWRGGRCPACGRDAGGDPTLAEFGRCGRCHVEVEARARCPVCLGPGHQPAGCSWVVDLASQQGRPCMAAGFVAN